LQKVEKRKREGKKIRPSGKTVFVIKYGSTKIVIKINKL